MGDKTIKLLRESDFFKTLSDLSNRDRGLLLELHAKEIEKGFGVELIKHDHSKSDTLTTVNPILPFEERFGKKKGKVNLMEFKPITDSSKNK